MFFVNLILAGFVLSIMFFLVVGSIAIGLDLILSNTLKPSKYLGIYLLCLGFTVVLTIVNFGELYTVYYG